MFHHLKLVSFLKLRFMIFLTFSSVILSHLYDPTYKVWQSNPGLQELIFFHHWFFFSFFYIWIVKKLLSLYFSYLLSTSLTRPHSLSCEFVMLARTDLVLFILLVYLHLFFHFYYLILGYLIIHFVFFSHLKDVIFFFVICDQT